ncbi:glycosyl hydrolase [Sedimentibacter sp. zth1]|uniref:glycosyl hydrolase n=1 Tax=Sedimentibacter sp. zth1 TaxID=2816908 RepID=UPI001A92F3B4|nr:glycosyl hydrolase [Sedimentibacter sp. zth1]QSX06911.1 glycosyl hydrolase [Sedimentibacter sp. zth1]
MKKIAIILIIVIIALAIYTNVKNNDFGDINNSNYEEKIKVNNSAWTVYWDTNNIIEEIEIIKNELNDIYLFSTYFDKNDKIVIPQQLLDTYSSVKYEYEDKNFNYYLTFVNDIKYENKSSSLKDTDILYRLLGEDENRQKHINDIISITKKYGFDGIEIDYENIRKDMHLWDVFNKFCKDLYTQAVANNIDVRITLESLTPFEKLTFSEGPTYAIMCYNLFGISSKPGPKANTEFLKNVVEKASTLPGKKEFAIATGGFNWAEGEKTVSLTEKQARKLQIDYNCTAQRDNESQTLYFQYLDDADVLHKVFYADSTTLNYWRSIINKSDTYGISIWRLGGNNFNGIE